MKVPPSRGGPAQRSRRPQDRSVLTARPWLPATSPALTSNAASTWPLGDRASTDQGRAGIGAVMGSSRSPGAIVSTTNPLTTNVTAIVVSLDAFSVSVSAALAEGGVVDRLLVQPASIATARIPEANPACRPAAMGGVTIVCQFLPHRRAASLSPLARCRILWSLAANRSIRRVSDLCQTIGGSHLFGHR